MSRRFVVALLATTLLAAPAGAQQEERRPSPDFPGEAIIYRDVGYSGPAVNVSRVGADRPRRAELAPYLR